MTAIIRRPAGGLRAYGPFVRPHGILQEVEAIAREMFDGRKSFWDTEFSHGIDVYREKDDLVIKAELPGVKKKDLDISLEDDILTIKAEKTREETTEDAEHYLTERHFGTFTRRMKLPFPVDSEKISTTFKNGLLEMKLPKSEEAGPKKIEIKAK